MTWIRLFFLKKNFFFRDKLKAVLTSPPKSIFTERRKSFCSMSEYEAIFFGEKTSIFLRDKENAFLITRLKISVRCENFTKLLSDFRRRPKKFPPNFGRGMEIYILFRSNNDPRNVNLDMFTTIWTISLKFFTIEPLGHLEWIFYSTALNVLTRSDFFSLNDQISFKKIFFPKNTLQKVFLET